MHAFKHSLCFEDLLLELSVTAQVSLNFLKTEVDKHTGNLGGEFTAGVLLDKVENGVSNRLVKHWVVSFDGGNKLVASVIEALFVVVGGG